MDNPSVIDYVTSFKQYDIGGSLGGYFIKDKLWFFAAYDYNKTETGNTANGTDPLLLLNGRPAQSWAHDTGYMNTETDPQYAFKLTWNVSPNHKLALSVFGDNYKNDFASNVATLDPLNGRAVNEWDTYAVSLQWNATWTPKFFTEAVISRRDSQRHRYPAASSSPGGGWSYYYRFGTNFNVIPEGVPNSYNPTTFGIDLSSWRPSLGLVADYKVSDINDQVRLKGTNLFTAAGRH
jgi:hypothetical protein